jgi:hypothetical protein
VLQLKIENSKVNGPQGVRSLQAPRPQGVPHESSQASPHESQVSQAEHS